MVKKPLHCRFEKNEILFRNNVTGCRIGFYGVILVFLTVSNFVLKMLKNC